MGQYRAYAGGPMEHIVICSKHFINNEKSSNQFAPSFVPTIFKLINSPMKQKIKAQMAEWVVVSQECLEENNKQVKFYTGLPLFAVLLAITVVIKGLPECSFSGCPMFEQPLMKLCKT